MTLQLAALLLLSCTGQRDVLGAKKPVAEQVDSSPVLEDDTGEGLGPTFPARVPPHEEPPASIRRSRPDPPSDIKDIKAQINALEEYTRERAEQKVPSEKMHDLDYYERKHSYRKPGE